MSGVKDNIFDGEFWENLHDSKDTVWHMKDVHPKLIKHHDRLFFKDTPHKVFVPLCGKAVDMKWFYDKGCYVVGVDCVVQPLKEFFDEQKIAYSVKETDKGIVCSSDDGRVVLYACDIFKTSDLCDTKDFDIIWDRGSLVALNTADWPRYVDLMTSLVAKDFRYLLETFEYDPTEYGGPPKTMSDDRVRELYQSRYKVEILEKDNINLSRFAVSHAQTRITILTPLA